MGYEASKELKPLVKLLTSFSYSHGKSITDVFDDFLQYIIYGFDCTFKKVDNWPYTHEQTKIFGDMFAEWVQIMSVMLNKRGWYDAFGDIYMELVSGKMRQQGNGQFFTPHTICDFMAKVTIDEGKHAGRISDCACGSGRCLLAANAISPGNYYVAQDVDRTCCLMTVCNFIIHGMVGEVIWGDALDPTNFHGGWKTNELLNTAGLPCVRAIEKHESQGYVNAMSALVDKERSVRKIVDKQEEKPITNLAKPRTTSKKKSVYEQMSLFDGVDW